MLSNPALIRLRGGPDCTMKAVILAAGVGSRLRPITLDRPKCCVTVNSVPILERQLRAYAEAGVDEVHVVAGYLADQVRTLGRAVASDLPGVTVTVHENETYANTDNMYSLSIVRERVAGEPFLLSNGDVACDAAIFAALVSRTDGSAIACNASAYEEEAMKVTVDDDSLVDHIAKDVSRSEAHATSLDVYRFSASCSARLFDAIRRRVEVEGAYDHWTELAIDDVVSRDGHDVEPVDVGDVPWVEVDDLADLLAADRSFASMAPLATKDAVFFDLDGTVYVDDEPVEEAADLVADLRAAGTEVFFLSNNSSKWKTSYAETLTGMGIPADQDEVILSTDAVLDYLDDEGVTSSYVVGTEAMRAAVERTGVDPEADDPEVVVVGFDTELTYEKTRRATLAIRDGASFLLAHPDLVCPSGEGLVPDCGSIGALVETATGREPDRVFGKPNPEMVRTALATSGLDPADVAVVGDRIGTDIALADALGCESVCVLTGDADRAAIETASIRPTLVVENVGELRRPGLLVERDGTQSVPSEASGASGASR